MTVFLPLIYLSAGWILGRLTWDFKTAASWLLTKITIPVVIIFNISTQFSNMSTIITVTVISMFLLLALCQFVTHNPVKSLCFSYLNIGWLGLPVASTLFGNDAATIIIAAYVGSSIVGNSFGAILLSGKRLNLIKLIQTPPVLASIVGACLIPFSGEIYQWFSEIYTFSKFTMSFLGMAVLGLWLAKIKLCIKDILLEVPPFLIRSGVIFILISLLFIIAYIMNFSLITDNPLTVYLFCLLPPAANIIVLETHYSGTGHSAKIITSGTCVSIIAIAFYAVSVLGYRALILS